MQKPLMFVFFTLFLPISAFGQGDFKPMDPKRAAELEASWTEFVESGEYKRKKDALRAKEIVDAVFQRSDFINVLKAIQENKHLFEELEWSSEQKKHVGMLIGEVATLDKAQLSETTRLPDEVYRHRRKPFLDEIAKTCIGVQSEELVGMYLNQGNLHKVVLTSELLKRHLEITPEQKKRIQERSNRLAMEVKEFIAQKRKEAGSIVESELTESQNNKLAAIYGANALNNSFSIQPIRRLVWNLLVGSDEEKEFEKDPTKRSDFLTAPVDIWPVKRD